MKKIHFIFIFMLNMLFMFGYLVKPNAASIQDVSKPLICERGKDYHEYLQYDGYTIESSNVNFNISGRYLVKYSNDSTDEEVYKFVYVEDMETLKKDVCYSEQYTTLYNTGELEKVNCVEKLKDSSYIYAHTEQIYEAEDLGIFYLTKVKDDKVIFQIKIVEGIRGFIVDVEVINDLIVVLMETDTSGGYSDITFYVFDQNGSKLYGRIFKGDGIDTCSKLLYDDNYIYIVGETTSIEGIFSFYHDYKSGVIIVLDISTFKEVGIYSMVTEGDVTVSDACIVENQLYVVIEYFNNTIASLLYELHIFDNTSLSFVRKQFLSYKGGITFQCITSFNGKIYMVFWEYESSTKLYYTRLYTYTSTGGKKLINEYTYTKEGNARLVDLIITEDESIILLYNLIKVTEVYDYGYLYQIIKDKTKVCEIENYSTNCATYGLLDTNEMLLKNQETTFISDIVYSALSNYKTEVEAEFDSDVKLPGIYMDGVLVKPNRTKSKINYDVTIFGEYPVTYYYEGVNQDVVVDGKIIVESYTNIYDGGIFDKGIIVHFNGDGNLNNLVIDSGYQIDRPGSYTLKLTGMNDVETINFEVRDLSHQEIILNNESLTYEEKLDIKEKDVNEIIIQANINEEEIPERVIDYQNWYLLIPLCAGIALVITFIKKRG